MAWSLKRGFWFWYKGKKSLCFSVPFLKLYYFVFSDLQETRKLEKRFQCYVLPHSVLKCIVEEINSKCEIKLIASSSLQKIITRVQVQQTSRGKDNAFIFNSKCWYYLLSHVLSSIWYTCSIVPSFSFLINLIIFFHCQVSEMQVVTFLASDLMSLFLSKKKKKTRFDVPFPWRAPLDFSHLTPSSSLHIFHT